MAKKPWRPAAVEDRRDASRVISEPTKPTEFEIQARIWSELRRLGFNARGEVKCPYAGRAVVRFDVAIFEAGRLVAVIEVKDSERITHETWSVTRQGARYQQFNVPVRLVCGSDAADRLLHEIAVHGPFWTARHARSA